MSEEGIKLAALRSFSLALVLILGLAPSAQATTSAVEIVGPDAAQFRASSEAEAMAFDQLLSFALENPDDFGYPRIGPEKEGFYLPVVTERGLKLFNAAISADALASDFSVAMVPGAVSVAKVIDLGNELIDLRSTDIPDGDFIWKTEPDQINNRVIVTVTKSSPDLFDALAKR